MGEILGVVSGFSCTQLAEEERDFILQKQVLASGDVASGCRVKRVANDGYSYFFVKKCTSKRGLAVFIQNCNGTI